MFRFSPLIILAVAALIMPTSAIPSLNFKSGKLWRKIGINNLQSPSSYTPSSNQLVSYFQIIYKTPAPTGYSPNFVVIGKNIGYTGIFDFFQSPKI